MYMLILYEIIYFLGAKLLHILCISNDFQTFYFLAAWMLVLLTKAWNSRGIVLGLGSKQ